MTGSQSINPSAVLHRRPAYAVNSPALLCHQCYRFRDVAESGSSELSKIRRNIATIELNTVLFHVQTAGLAHDPALPVYVFNRKPPRPDHNAEEAGAAQEQSAKQKAFAELIAQRSAQLREVDSQNTILANLPVMSSAPGLLAAWRGRVRVDLHSEFYSVTYILDARTPGECPPHTDPAKPGLLADAPADVQAKEYFDTWYEEAWTQFFALLELEGDRGFPVRDKFFECRGLAIPSVFKSRPDAVHDPIVVPVPTDEQAKEAKRQLLTWPNRHPDLLRLLLQLDQTGAEDKDANCILCMVLQGRALFASSMGLIGKAGTREASDPAAAPFERYLLVHDRVPRFQVGRLLRRFHVLDELRCAAIFDFPELIEASERLRTLGNSIDRRLHRAQQRSKPCLPADALSDIQKQLNNLTSGLRVPDQQPSRSEGSRAAGGLLYRINRSRYYADGFKLRMTDMLIERIEGWEPYDLFMHRNLFPIIDHINSIGQRFDALAARVERLTEASDVDELINVQSEIAYIQTIGEYIGWTAFAYYGGQILDKLFPGPESCALCEWVDICRLLGGHLGTALSTLLAIWAWSHFRARRRMQEKERAS